MAGLLRPFLVAMIVVAAFFLGASVGHRSDGIGDWAGDLFGTEDAELTSEAIDVISEKYFREVPEGDLEDASVRGMVAELRERFDDRFTHYFGPEAYSRFEQRLSGEFSGVGMAVTEVERGLRVATVFDGSPAQRAGIAAGDVITEVDGKSIAGEDADLATAQIKGLAGTEVTLTVLTPSSGERRRKTLTREQISVPSVESNMKRVDGRKVGYVRILDFTKHGTHAELRRAVEDLDARGAEGTIVDLRGNGGGLLIEAVLNASVFVEDGVIVSTRGRTQPDQTFEAEGDAVPARPVVVLINGDTASASEIFTAALDDAGLADVVGETSFGKGVFQEVIPLDSGGALDLTVGEYLTRDGVSLAGKGIEPEIPARDVPETEADEGLQKALRALGAKLAAQGGSAGPSGE